MSNPKCANPFNRYATMMADIGLQRNPMAQEVILVLNKFTADTVVETEEGFSLTDPSDPLPMRDHYQDYLGALGDGQHTPQASYSRIKKWAKVTKDPKLSYVQFDDTENLLEDTGNPWIVSMTVTGIVDAAGNPRLPRTDDQILIDGILYTISLVEPVNRFVDGLINCTVYPERSYQDDPLKVHSASITRCTDTERIYSVIWGGAPVEYSFDESEWIPFASYFKVTGPIFPVELYLRDEDGNVSEPYNLPQP